MKVFRHFLVAVLIISFSTIFCALFAYSQEEFPKPIGYVNDFANLIPQSYRDEMAQIAYELERKTGAQVAVVTIETLGEKYSIEDYANRLYEKWGIGQKGKDNGVLILVAAEERRLWIEVGYGFEGILPDGLVGEIEDTYMVPHLRKNDYGKGLSAGLAAIVGIIAKDAGVEITGVVAPQRRGSDSHPAIGLLWPLIFFLLVPFLLFRRKRRGVYMSPWFWGGFGGFGGGFGGGSSGGGFGGFGGGLSGGGGAGRGF